MKNLFVYVFILIIVFVISIAGEDDADPRRLQYGYYNRNGYRRNPNRRRRQRNPKNRRFRGNNLRPRNNRRGRNPNNRAVDPPFGCGGHTTRRACRHDGRCTWDGGKGYGVCRTENSYTGGTDRTCRLEGKSTCKQRRECKWDRWGKYCDSRNNPTFRQGGDRQGGNQRGRGRNRNRQGENRRGRVRRGRNRRGRNRQRNRQRNNFRRNGPV